VGWKGKDRGKPRRGGINVVAHTYTNIVIHALFSTKDRRPWINVEMRRELFPYMGGIVNRLGGKSLLVNGVADHVHMLLNQGPDLPLAELVGKVKANSSGWIKKRWPVRSEFAWQPGYAAFSVSSSRVEEVKKYIAAQEEHHRKVSFHEEVLAFLQRNGISYDPRYVFG
jgi:putative transposase